ncbi:DUF3039 domain-containing protein [Actinobaculum suis]
MIDSSCAYFVSGSAPAATSYAAPVASAAPAALAAPAASAASAAPAALAAPAASAASAAPAVSPAATGTAAPVSAALATAKATASQPEPPAGPGQPEGPNPEGSQSVGILERTEEQLSDGDDERFAHYVRKDRQLESAFTGKPVVALCGKVWVPTRNPDNFPICPMCKEIHEQMGNQGSAWPFGPDVPGSGQ